MLATLVALVAVGPRLQLGTTWGGVEVVRFVDAAEDIDQRDTRQIRFRITGSEDRYWVAERQVLLLETVANGAVLKSDPKDKPAKDRVWFTKTGELAYLDPFDSGRLRLNRLMHFWLPESLPAQWTVQLDREGDRFVSKAEAKFTAMGQTKTTRSYRLEYRETEAPNDMTARGEVVFDLATGRILSEKLEAKHVLIPGGVDKASATLDYRDSEVAK